MRKLRVIPFLFVIALAAGACGGTAPDAAPSSASSASPKASPSPASDDSENASGNEVTIEDFAFAPKRLKIETGETVTWTNKDDILHTVTSGRGQKQGVPGVTENKDAKPDGMFDQEVEFEETFEFTFEDPGTYSYFCSIHPGMVGTVVVN